VLALAGKDPVVAHVRHDLRPDEQANADRDATRRLAEALGLAFVEAAVRLRSQPGNAESLARRARYEALASLARQNGLAYVATGHHADDQLETLLLRLCRGAGVNGLRGIAPRRVEHGVTIIRPMLNERRADCQALCARAGYAWCEDASNADQSRARAALRHSVVPMLEQIFPKAPINAARVASHLRTAADCLSTQVDALLEQSARDAGALAWPRSLLRTAHPWVLGELLRRSARVLAGEIGADRIGARPVNDCVRAIVDRIGGERVFRWRNVEILICRDTVEMRERPDAG